MPVDIGWRRKTTTTFVKMVLHNRFIFVFIFICVSLSNKVVESLLRSCRATALVCGMVKIEKTVCLLCSFSRLMYRKKFYGYNDTTIVFFCIRSTRSVLLKKKKIPTRNIWLWRKQSAYNIFLKSGFKYIL